MNVKKLIEELQDLDLSLEVVLSKDAEGNRFSPFEELTVGRYEPDNSHSGQFDEHDLDSDFEQDEKNAVCLWPVN